MDKRTHRKEELKADFLRLYKNLPGLSEGYKPPPGGLQNLFLRLNKTERELLEEAINELIEDGIIAEDWGITEKGIKKNNF
jgi:hypothetical protein